jgi:RNA:NAD 2'-phosphotransferase (TPT1/KptA family)
MLADARSVGSHRGDDPVVSAVDAARMQVMGRRATNRSR